MTTLKRTDSTDPDFISIVRLLDAELAARDGKDAPFFAQYNKIDNIRHVIVAYKNGAAAACGAFKPYEEGIAEIKRMFTKDDFKRQGLAAAILKALEGWCRELGFTACVLETGKAMPEAIALYEKCGYHYIPNYGQYKNVFSSVCLRKEL